mgnify:CR=1 FL=1
MTPSQPSAPLPGTGVLIGLDLGTTNIKALALAVDDGRVLGVVRAPTPTIRPRPNWTEHDADALWQTAAGCIARLLKDACPGVRPRALSIGSMAEAGLLVDRQGRPLCPIIAWHDPRTEPYRRRFEAQVGVERLYAITGQVPRQIFSLYKLLWLREYLPDAWARAKRWLCVPDFVTFRLCGAQVTDYSIASRTLLLDQATGTWSQELLDAAGLDRALLPELVPAGTVAGTVRAAAAAATGLPEGIPVVVGGHDHHCASLAVGAVTPERVLDSTGTAETVLALSDRFRPDPALLYSGIAQCRSLDPRRVALFASLPASGGLLAWVVADLLDRPAGEGWEAALEAAAAVEPGAHGLLCLPYLRGAVTPHADPAARAAFLGFRDGHTWAHVLRAAAEGIALWLRSALESLEHVTGSPVKELVVVGGSARGELLLRLRADVTGRTVIAPDLTEGVALGAALLAGVGAGVYASLDEAVGTLRLAVRQLDPEPDRLALYERLYREVYRDLYSTLRPVLARLQALGGGE